MLKKLGRGSHGTVVAYIALFLAIGGGAIAIAGGHKLSGKKLKKRSTPANRLKKHTITGTEVNLDKLGKVPTAANADVAGALGNVTFVNVKKVNSSASAAFATAEAAATPVTLYDDSHFQLYGKCFVDTSVVPNQLNAYWFIASKQTGAIFKSNNDELSGGPPDGYLDTNSLETNREVIDANAELNGTDFSSTYNWGFEALAADGYHIRGRSIAAAKFGSQAAGDGLYGPGNVCLFTGDVQVLPG